MSLLRIAMHLFNRVCPELSASGGWEVSLANLTVNSSGSGGWSDQADGTYWYTVDGNLVTGTTQSSASDWSLSDSGSGTYWGDQDGGRFTGTASGSSAMSASSQYEISGVYRGGQWSWLGTAEATQSNASDYAYVGSGGYTRPIAGGTLSGQMSASGVGGQSYRYQTDYTLAQDGSWTLRGGSGSASAVSEATISYSGSGSYSRQETEFGSITLQGTVEENGSKIQGQQYALTAELGAGGWTHEGSGSTWGSQEATFSYSGSGVGSNDSSGTSSTSWPATYENNYNAGESTTTWNRYQRATESGSASLGSAYSSQWAYAAASGGKPRARHPAAAAPGLITAISASTKPLRRPTARRRPLSRRTTPRTQWTFTIARPPSRRAVYSNYPRDTVAVRREQATLQRSLAELAGPSNRDPSSIALHPEAPVSAP